VFEPPLKRKGIAQRFIARMEAPFHVMHERLEHNHQI